MTPLGSKQNVIMDGKGGFDMNFQSYEVIYQIFVKQWWEYLSFYRFTQHIILKNINLVSLNSTVQIWQEKVDNDRDTFS